MRKKCKTWRHIEMAGLIVGEEILMEDRTCNIHQFVSIEVSKSINFIDFIYFCFSPGCLFVTE